MVFRALLAAVLVFAATLPARAAGLVVTSPDARDGGAAPVAGAQPGCGGGSNASLALAWTGAPAGTRSFVIILSDVDNWFRAGLAAHWIAYGIAATTTSVPQGFGTQTAAYVPGANFSNAPGFRGYCPPKGDTPHHYVYTVLATDLAPNALPAGLDRNALTAALKGHTLAGSSIVVTYGQAP